MEIDPENIIHVLPLNDIEAHSENCIFPLEGTPYCKCKCNPRHEEVPPSGMVVIHNSVDGREGIEWFNEIIK